MSLLPHFPPGFKPRPIQVDILNRVEAAFEAGKRFIIIEAPPGTGKSHVAATLSAAYGPAYVLTLTKQLQSQYEGLFHPLGARVLKGRAAFQCPRCGDNCAIGGKKYKCPKQCDPCGYKIAKKAAFWARMCICNYQSYLFNVSAVHGGERPLLICDEGHELEEVLLDYISITIVAGSLPIRTREPFPLATDVDACFEWLVSFLVDAANCDRDRLGEKAQIELENLESKAAYALECRARERWIVEPVTGKTGFCLKPLTVRSFGERLFQYGERVVIMSATILDPEMLADMVGIDLKEMAYIQAPCPFPVENRQIVASSLNMMKSNRDNAWPAMVRQIDLILQLHAEDKGLLLCPSNEMMQYVLNGLPVAQARRLVLASGLTRKDEYDRHCNSSKPTVLAACGYWEGADLFGDRSRCQIIPSIPRPMWSGQIAARGKMDPRWYRWRAMTKLIQGCGRSIRSESDFATTYVLDGALRTEFDAHDSLLPDWFREAIIFV